MVVNSIVCSEKIFAPKTSNTKGSAKNLKIGNKIISALTVRLLNGKNESNNIAANKGRLPMPISGGYMITQHYGVHNVDGLSGVQLDNKGINITGKSGAQARAIFDGEVSAIFSLGGF